VALPKFRRKNPDVKSLAMRIQTTLIKIYDYEDDDDDDQKKKKRRG